MLNSVFFFTWENVYTLRQELHKWKTAFVEKYWSDSLFVFNSENWDNWVVNQALYAWGLFVSKKLVILEGIPKESNQDWWIPQDKIDKFLVDFENNQKFLTADTIVAFVSSKPDKRTKLYKWLSSNAQLKEFPVYREAKVKTFIKENLSPLQISEEGLNYFLEKIWADLFRLSSEIEKLKYVVKEWEVTREMIDTYCFWMTEENAFSVFDALFESPKNAVKMIENMQNEGKDWNAVLPPLQWSLKVILTFIDYANQWIRDSKVIAAESKLAPFTVSKNIGNMDLYLSHQGKLENLFKTIVDVEYSIKTGKYPDTYFWLTVKKAFLGF